MLRKRAQRSFRNIGIFQFLCSVYTEHFSRSEIFVGEIFVWDFFSCNTSGPAGREPILIPNKIPSNYGFIISGLLVNKNRRRTILCACADTQKNFYFFPALKTREKRRPMLNIKTIKNSLISDESKDGFCFRSSCSQNLSQKKLAAEKADWNSSFTEADYLGMLSVMEKSL